jgi:hypothetical protein
LDSGKVGGSASAGSPIFFVCGGFFLFCGGVAFLQGFLRKVPALVWCFRGVNVVICVADVVF